MAQASRDENRVPTLIGVSSADGTTPTLVEVDTTTNGMHVQIVGDDANTITDIVDGVKTVTSAGTDEALASSTTCKRVTIQAQTDNTSSVAIGATGVDATIATGTGIILDPGDVYELDIDNLADVFVDALVSGEGVRFTYFT